MFCGLAAIIAVWKLSNVAYTWYVLIGACVTFSVGALVSRVFGGNGAMPVIAVQGKE